MNFINLNDEIRDILKNAINRLIYDESRLTAMSEDEAIIKYRDNLYDVDLMANQRSINFKEQMILTMCLDTYKMYLYKQKEGICTNKELQELQRLMCMKDKDDILTELSADINLFKSIIENSYHFSSYDQLTKIMIMKSLSYSEKQFLSNLIVSNKFDLVTYDVNVDMQLIIDNIKKNIEQNEEELEIDFSEGIVLRICGFIRNLLKIDNFNGIKLLLEIVKIDYAGSKYLSALGIENQFIDDKVDLYERYSVDDIIFRLSTSQEYLTSAIWMLYSVYITGDYDEIKIDDKLIKSNDSDKMNKKLLKYFQ